MRTHNFFSRFREDAGSEFIALRLRHHWTTVELMFHCVHTTHNKIEDVLYNGQYCPTYNDSMAFDDELGIILLLYARRRRLRRRKRSVWVRDIYQRRRQQGEYCNLLQEMRLSYPESHFRYLRMSKERFHLF